MQDFHAKILASNLTAALALAGQWNLEKTRRKNGPIYLISLGQACTKMKLYQAKLWRLTGIPLAEYLRKLILLLSQFKEQARTERIFPRKVSKFNRQRYWMHYKYTL